MSELDQEGRPWTLTLQPLPVLHVHFALDKPPAGCLAKTPRHLAEGLLQVTCLWVPGQKATPGEAEQKAACKPCLTVQFCSAAAGRPPVPPESPRLSFQLIRWALFSGPVHSPLLHCGTWSSPNAWSQLSPRYFQPCSVLPEIHRAKLNRSIWRPTRIQMELLTFEVGAVPCLPRIWEEQHQRTRTDHPLP